MRAARVAILAMLLSSLGVGQAQTPFLEAAAWTASASDQVRASTRAASDGLCLDADFGGVSGYAVMRREWPLQWPEPFDLELQIKGQGAVNDVQIKFVDASGDNVWWVHRPQMKFAPGWQTWRLKQRHVQFAWGPTQDKSLRHTRFIEVVVAAAQAGPQGTTAQAPRGSGRSSVCVASMRLTPRMPDPQAWPAPTASSDDQALTLDWGVMREFNGLSVAWPQTLASSPSPVERNYDIQLSRDGQQWDLVREVRGSTQKWDAVFLPEQESRWVRLVRKSSFSQWPEIQLRSASEWPDLNAVMSTQAQKVPRGHVPRAFVGEQNYWTLVGVDGGGAHAALLSEDGAVELGRGGPSIEPVVRLEGASSPLVTWADVQIQHELPKGYIPQPVVRWTHPSFVLEIQVGADGSAKAPQTLARYTLRNTSPREQTYTLAWVLRPWQVNPPQQFLNTPGGVRSIHSVAWTGQALWADGKPRIVPTLPSGDAHAAVRFSALPFDAGLNLETLLAAPQEPATTGPRPGTLHDPQSLLSAALQQRVTLPPGVSMTWGWWSASQDHSALTPVTTAALEGRLRRAAATWQQRLSRVGLQLPDSPQVSGAHVVNSVRSALAHMLMSRDGPWLQPGTRSYARTWIRDGAMMVAGLLRLGEPVAAREFVDAFARKIFESGKVPCCVDARGADPVVENDSHGQYLFSVAEVWRHTRDRAWLSRHWSTVEKVVAYQESLRQSQRTELNRTPERAHFFGLMPPSISHEGYSDKPAFSYWDDFWALRGYKDAVVIAQALAQPQAASAWARWRDEFEAELQQSVAASMKRYGIDHVPGAADRGDFDATSTTVALNPAQASLPPEWLDATFARYAQWAQARAEGRIPWKDYTPYELRTMGALVRLGRREQAYALLRFFFADQRPAGWNQWAEVVLPGYREPRFLGDMPHAWVSSDYVRSALDLWVLEHEASRTLRIGPGWPVQALSAGVSVRRLSTSWGPVSYELQGSAQGWTLDLDTPTIARVRLSWPGTDPLPKVTDCAWRARECTLPGGRRRVVLTAQTPRGSAR